MTKQLENCKDCGGVLSVSAKSCPHCGAQVKAKTKPSTKIIGVLFAFTIAVIVFSQGTEQGPSASDRMADNATKLCAALKKAGASTCEVDFNVTEPSYINATLNIASSVATEFCNGIARNSRDGGLTLATPSRPWELRIFQPSNVRPVVSCPLS